MGNTNQRCNEYSLVADGQFAEETGIELVEQETIFLLFGGVPAVTVVTTSLGSGSCTCFSGFEGPESLEEGGVTTGKAYRLSCDATPCAAVIAAATSGFFGYSYFITPDEDATCDEYTLVGQGVRTVSRECVEMQQQETILIVYEPLDVGQDRSFDRCLAASRRPLWWFVRVRESL
eukprot:scaffold26441_cov142-Cylindrotheca_fusiformis.AAC.2